MISILAAQPLIAAVRGWWAAPALLPRRFAGRFSHGDFHLQS
jgi:hypothetical protein